MAIPPRSEPPRRAPAPPGGPSASSQRSSKRSTRRGLTSAAGWCGQGASNRSRNPNLERPPQRPVSAEFVRQRARAAARALMRSRRLRPPRRKSQTDAVSLLLTPRAPNQAADLAVGFCASADTPQRPGQPQQRVLLTLSPLSERPSAGNAAAAAAAAATPARGSVFGSPLSDARFAFAKRRRVRLATTVAAAAIDRRAPEPPCSPSRRGCQPFLVVLACLSDDSDA